MGIEKRKQWARRLFLLSSAAVVNPTTGQTVVRPVGAALEKLERTRRPLLVNRQSIDLRAGAPGVSPPPPPPGPTPPPPPPPPTPPPSANYTVYNDAEFATAYAAATNGQSIRLGDGGVFGTLTIAKAGLTVFGQSFNHVCRKIDISAAQNTYLLGCRVQANEVPVATGAGQTIAPKLVTLAGNCNGTILRGNWIRGGNPWNGYADFDVTVTDELRMGSATAGWPARNPYLFDLWYGIGQGATVPSGSLTFDQNIIEDVGQGFKPTWGGGGALEITRNIIRRCYQDGISTGIPSNGAAATRVWVLGNLVEDLFAQPQDMDNPHGDAILQWFTADSAPVYALPVPDMRVVGNVYRQRPGCRGEPQIMFLSDFADGYPLENLVAYGNLGFSRISSTYLTVDSRDAPNIQTGAVWGHIERNILLANPAHNAPIQNETALNSATGITASAATSLGTITIRSDNVYGYPANLIRRNIAENIANDQYSTMLDNIATGRGGAPGAFGTWFDLPAGYADWTAFWNDWSDEEDVFKFVSSIKPAFADRSPLDGAATMAAYRERWGDPAQRPWNTLPSAVSFRNISGVGAGTTNTSDPAFVHAGGQTRALHGTGGEYRVGDDRNMTNATAWAAIPGAGSPGTIQHGKFLQRRITSSAVSLGQVTATTVIGAESFPWTVQTEDLSAYPQVDLDFATPDIFRRAAASLGADGQLGTLALLGLRVSGNPAATRTIFGTSSGSTRLSVQVLSTGKLRVNLVNSSSVIFARVDTTINVTDGIDHDIIVSWDTSQATAGAGISLYMDGIDRATSALWAAGTINYGFATLQYQFGNADCRIGAFYLNTAARVDVTSPTERAKFSAGAIGTTGAGVTGAQPLIFLVGNAAQWNDAGGVNRGSGGAFVKVGSAAAADAGAGDPWA